MDHKLILEQPLQMANCPVWGVEGCLVQWKGFLSLLLPFQGEREVEQVHRGG